MTLDLAQSARRMLPTLVLLALVALAGSAAASHLSGPVATYTLNSDFDEGAKVQVDHIVANQLQLPPTAQPKQFPFIWIAVSGSGTAVKIDVNTGAVLGEYKTAPDGMQTNPSRTSVDFNGNVWATNRNEGSALDGTPKGSVVHFGLKENAQCVDRNGNSVIDTSTGLGDVRAWTNAGGVDTDGGVQTAADECIIHFVRTNPLNDRHVSVTADNDVWVSGTGHRAFDLIDGDTGAILRAEPSINCGGYGGLIDSRGVIWSARPFLRWDTALPISTARCDTTFDSYGMCLDSQGNVWNTELGSSIRKFAPDGTLLGTFPHGFSNAQGCAVDFSDHVWVAHSIIGGSSVGHLKNDGSLVGVIPVGNGPTGVSVDVNGKVWVTNHNSFTAMRIDPTAGALGPDLVTPIGAVDLTTVNLGGALYNYSDMTGGSLRYVRPRGGSWTVVHDSTVEDARWGRVSWNANVPAQTFLNVSVATSVDGLSFSPFQRVTSGSCFSAPDGRYAKVRVDFVPNELGTVTPVLYDLSLGVLPLGKARSTALWAGVAEPASVEYETHGVRISNAGSDLQRLVLVDLPQAGLYADAMEEQGSAATDCVSGDAYAYGQSAEVRLANGLVVLETLVQEASVAYDATTGASAVSNTSYIAKVLVNGQQVNVAPVTGPQTFALPGGITLALFERALEQNAYGVSFRENIVHLYAANSLAPGAAYGRAEVIVGGLQVQAGLVRFAEPKPHILGHDDARSGRDAGDTPATAIPIGIGAHDGSTPPGDRVDLYAIAVTHGEKVVAVLDPALRLKAHAGFASLVNVPPPVVVQPTLAGPGGDVLYLRLYDPTGALREWSDLNLGGGPQRVELNADLDGTWHVEVARASSQANQAWNYSLALSITPLALLPQNDALSGADAPAACNTAATGIPAIQTGVAVGVVRDADFVDVYTFTANIGEAVALVLKPGEDADGVDMALALYDRDCQLLQRVDTALSETAKGVPESITALPSLYTGRYFVAIERVNGVGNHFLTLAVVNPLPTLPNNDAGTGQDAGTSWTDANAIAPATPVFQGRLEENDAGDAYKLTFQAGKRVVIAVDVSAFTDADVALKDASGSIIGQQVGNLWVFNFIPTGTQYGLEISSLTSGGNYMVAVAQAPV